MIVIAVDDEQIALNNLELTLEKIPEITKIVTFSSPEKALEWLKGSKADIAFLDINMGHINGLTLAKHFKEVCPSCAIVFVTGYSEYAVEAFEIHASGYLMKPVSSEAVAAEVQYILQSSAPQADNRVRVQCFGNFEVFANDKPMQFKYSKTRELLAYLIDRRGAFCEIGMLCAVLWEDKPDSAGLKSQLRHLISDLSAKLKAADADDILLRRRGAVAIVPEKLKCDYYDWLNGDTQAINMYAGEYMLQYSWAEMTKGILMQSE